MPFTKNKNAFNKLLGERIETSVEIEQRLKSQRQRREKLIRMRTIQAVELVIFLGGKSPGQF